MIRKLWSFAALVLLVVLISCGDETSTTNPGTTPSRNTAVESSEVSVGFVRVAGVQPKNRMRVPRRIDIQVSASVQGTARISLIELKRDGDVYDRVEDSSRTFTMSFDTLGIKVLEVTAYDNQNRRSTVQRLEVDVVSVDDTSTGTAPVVQWVSPNTGANLQGVELLEVNVTDPNGSGSDDDGQVKSVLFQAGSVELGQATRTTANNWRLEWNTAETLGEDTLRFLNGEWQLTAIATDDTNEVTRAVRTVTLNNSDASKTPPVVSISTPQDGAGPVSGVVNVTVDVRGVDITEVMLLVNDTPLPVRKTSAPYVFGLDTSQYDNGTLVLKARAFNGAGLTADSSPVTLTVSNIVSPLFAISDPASASTVKGTRAVEVTVTKRNAAFDYASDLVVNVIDYRGSIVATQSIAQADLHGSSDALYSTAGFDFSDFPDDEYTIEAQVTITVEPGTDNEEQRQLTDRISVVTTTSSKLPPALVIKAPIRLDAFNTSADPDRQFDPDVPEIGEFFKVFLNVTDDGGSLGAIEVRLVCDGSLPSAEDDVCISQPLDALLAYRSQPYDDEVLSVVTTGTPFIENGLYILRVVAIGGGGEQLRNVQEIAVRVNRDSNVANTNRQELAGPVSVNPSTITQEGGTAAWSLDLSQVDAGEQVRVSYTVFLDGTPKEYGVTQVEGGSSVEIYRRGFGSNDEGTWTLVVDTIQNLDVSDRALVKGGAASVAVSIGNAGNP